MPQLARQWALRGNGGECDFGRFLGVLSFCMQCDEIGVCKLVQWQVKFTHVNDGEFCGVNKYGPITALCAMRRTLTQ
jgi:hypothetical protein